MGSPDSRTLKHRVVVVTGASRGIGAAVAVRAAADGAAVALLAKTQTPNPKIAGTLGETADAVQRAGGRALPLTCDVRDAAAVAAAVEAVADAFGGIDVVINNAGALDLRPTAQLPPKSLRRLLEVNVEGPFAIVQAALPYLRRSGNAHVVNVAPPLNMDPRWVGAHVGHTVGKYAESLLTLGWAEEFASVPIAVNSLWPATTIASTGMMVAMGEETVRAQARSPQIMAEAVHALVTRPAAACSGHFYTDEEILREEGRADLSEYLLAANEDDLTPNFYLLSAPAPTV
ncbi:short chain dehydrogenase [Mycobacterium intracellulare]|uniref:Short chain dehydrogenase n=1 Tax=Mycobacterium intracellulare TaxID=1767 RepID=A0A7R7MRQ8_MYCIT|nr:SDR family oxidoreductase [Mycobacterium intracellulare]ETZ37871.1 short chain dehydrogenase family protein [Mycobacterium intracellulare MIN_061107_1834]BCO56247.1 short chain dehydrogenase [Mycobacterium intracellulare]BCO61568.1 short chain dehydrogenase [Mycobacterium intracellulare]BCO98622.1 short chain dehydrogenase [Mycobacterium intracellulare]BCP19832.1 short chain dehydrogenase [Mycobacterium intracellulare]